MIAITLTMGIGIYGILVKMQDELDKEHSKHVKVMNNFLIDYAERGLIRKILLVLFPSMCKGYKEYLEAVSYISGYDDMDIVKKLVHYRHEFTSGNDRVYMDNKFYNLMQEKGE